MADDATIKSGTAGSDIRMATDEAAFDGVNQSHAQLVKMVSGTADSTVRIAAAAGLAANALRTTLASDDPAVVALQIIDDWDESDRAKVNIIAGVAGITAGAGAVAAGTPRVTMASDSPDVASLATVVTNTNNLATILTSLQLIDDVVFAEDVAANAADKGISLLAVRRDADTSLVDATNDYSQLQVDARGALKVEAFSGEILPVSGTVTSNAGTNLNTSLLALEAGGNLAAIAASLAIIDDWDVADRANVNIIAGQTGVTAGAGAVAANTQRVTLASDDPAVASLSVMDDWDETDRAKVNVIVGVAGITAGAGAVAAGTPRMTLASDDPAVASLATIAALSKAEDAGHTTGQTGVMALAVRNDSAVAIATTDLDYIPLSTDALGSLRVVASKIVHADIDISTGFNVGAYVAGDQMGAIQTFSTSAARFTGGGGIVRGITVLDDADIIGMIDVVLLSASITLAADSSPFAISDADAEKIIGIVSISVGDIGNNRYGNAAPFIPYWCDATTLFFTMIARSAFAASLTNLRVKANLELD